MGERERKRRGRRREEGERKRGRNGRAKRREMDGGRVKDGAGRFGRDQG
jgi:hypothetical protein